MLINQTIVLNHLITAHKQQLFKIQSEVQTDPRT